MALTRMQHTTRSAKNSISNSDPFYSSVKVLRISKQLVVVSVFTHDLKSVLTSKWKEGKEINWPLEGDRFFRAQKYSINFNNQW